MSAASAEGYPSGAGFDRRLIPPLVLGAVLNPINTSILAVALVPIGRSLGVPTSQTAWLVSALYLATAIGQPVVGRLVDVYGPRRLFLAGGALVGLGGALGTVAPTLAVLVVARVVLGLGTCAGYPAAMTMIRREATRTGQDSPAGVLTVLAMSSQIIAVIGPTLGGLLIGLGGWRLTFAVNVPLSLASMTLGWRRLPRTGPGDVPAGRVRLDLPGIGLFTVLLTLLLLFLMAPSLDDGWLLAAAVAVAAGLARWELRTRDPFLDLRLLAGNRPLLATYARQLLGGLTMYAVLYGLTQWLEDGRGLHPAQVGVLLLPLSGSALIVSALTGRRPEIRLKLLVGAAFQLLGCAGLFLLGAASPVWLLVVLVVAFGIPQGLLNLGNQNALYHHADPARMASSAGLLRTAMYLGAIAASAAIGAFFGSAADTPALHRLAGFLLTGAVGLTALTLGDRSLREVGRTDPHPTGPHPTDRPSPDRHLTGHQ